MAVIFISHPFSGKPKENRRRVAALARSLAIEGHVPLAPQLFLPVFLDETTERSLAMQICLRLVSLADAVHIYGEPTTGMRLEIAEAHRLGIPIVQGRGRKEGGGVWGG